MTDIPYRFDRTDPAAELHAVYADLDPGAETGRVARVAGRLMLVRPQGRLAFAELRDGSGTVQLFALAPLTPDFAAFAQLRTRDWVGAAGEVVKTRTGELSVKVDEWVLLAEARRGFGDKWRGVTDVETRSRPRGGGPWGDAAPPAG